MKFNIVVFSKNYTFWPLQGHFNTRAEARGELNRMRDTVNGDKKGCNSFVNKIGDKYSIFKVYGE